MKRKIRYDVYIGFDDAPRAYDKKQLIIENDEDIDQSLDDLNSELKISAHDLKDIRHDTTDY